jgi:hypothetical protein
MARGALPLVAIAAIAMNLPGLAYLVALKDIAAGDHSTATAVVLVVVFNLVMFLLAEVPLVALIVAPARAETLVARLHAWLVGNGRTVATVLCSTLGVFLLARAVVNA